MDIVLDPREVLEHLQELGYRNITKEQLVEFIKDLKKLIKYEQLIASRQSSPCEGCTCSCSKRQNKVSAEKNKKVLHDNSGGSYDDSSSSSSSDICSSELGSVKVKVRTPLPGSYESAENGNQQKRPASKCKENVNRCPSKTFIRPQQARPKSSSAPPRSDPVALYQYYQQMWKQQKLPGEDPHTDLRWMIREKMLGQNPNPCPRPLSRASSTSTKSSTRVRL